MPGSNNNSQYEDLFSSDSGESTSSGSSSTSQGNKTEDPTLSKETVILSDKRWITPYPFYYDRMLLNSTTVVTLHANRVYVIEKPGEEGKWKDASEVSETLDDDGYIGKALYRSVLNEDYQINVSNSWSQFGDDAIGSMFNSLKPFAPYAAKLAEAAGIMSEKSKNMKLTGDKSIDSSFGRVMTNLAEHVRDYSDKGANILNRSLVAQGARFSYYSGTDVGFGNLTMKFTVFSGIRWNEDLADWEWKDVNSQLEPLYPYVMGKYTNGIIDPETGKVIQASDKEASIDTGVTGETAELINEFFSWQLPPGGYTPDTINYDKAQKGTLKLKLGVFYSIPSLVCVNSQFQFSKQMTKHWNEEKKRNEISPLYCDVILTFQPVVKFSDDVIKKLVSGKTEITSINKLRTGLNNRLDTIKKNL